MLRTDASKGFTLVELLIVIAIIGLLASIVLASTGTARKKGRDARRLSDFKSIQAALELYYSSSGSSYPPANTWAALGTALNAGYINGLPSDPGGYAYTYQSITAAATPVACAVAKCEGYLMRAQTEYTNFMAADVIGVGAVPSANCTVAGGPPYDYCIRK